LPIFGEKNSPGFVALPESKKLPLTRPGRSAACPHYDPRSAALPLSLPVDVVFLTNIPDQVLDGAQLGKRIQDIFGIGEQGACGSGAGQKGSAQRGKVRVMLYLKDGDGQVIRERSKARIVKVQ
jgi:hypothetical protein